MRLRSVGESSRLAGVVRFALVLAGACVPIAPRARADGPPTFTKDVAPILHRHCLDCHRRGEVGPFPLENYGQARKRAGDIVAVVEDRLMPPWKPARGVGPKLKHDRSLAPAEIAVLRAWAEAGAPEGEPEHMPETPRYADGWLLGTPDVVLEPAEDFTVPADGPDIYRCFVIPTDLPDDVFIEGIEYRPGNRRVVHHLTTFIDVAGAGRRLDAADDGPGYTSFTGPGFDPIGELGFWTAGNRPTRLPEGVGFRLPKGADVVVQIHYHPSGKAEADRTRIGLHLAKGPVKRVLHWHDTSNFNFRLPAGRDRIKVDASWCVPVDVEALAVSPHMHLLGREMRMTVTYPNGRTIDLIHIPEWDPDWQNTYYFEKPIPLPRGSVVRVSAHFDNSDHPRNPNSPPKLVKSGHRLKDEMCVGYIALVKTDQDLTRPGERDDLFVVLAAQRLRKYMNQQFTGRRH